MLDFQSQIHSICYNRIHFAEPKKKQQKNQNTSDEYRKEGAKTWTKLFFG